MPANVTFIVIQTRILTYPQIRIESAITNLLEAINYSLNFYLYCVANGEIRKSILRSFHNLTDMVCKTK